MNNVGVYLCRSYSAKIKHVLQLIILDMKREREREKRSNCNQTAICVYIIELNNLTTKFSSREKRIKASWVVCYSIMSAKILHVFGTCLENTVGFRIKWGTVSWFFF